MNKSHTKQIPPEPQNKDFNEDYRPTIVFMFKACRPIPLFPLPTVFTMDLPNVSLFLLATQAPPQNRVIGLDIRF